VDLEARLGQGEQMQNSDQSSTHKNIRTAFGLISEEN
jgi:hypothetical protein